MDFGKKWYQRSWWIVISLLIFFPLGLFLMWKYANWCKLAKVLVTCPFALFVMIGAFSSKESSTVNISTDQPTILPKTYEKLGYENLKTVENFSYLYIGADKTKETIEKTIREIRVGECKKLCNISLYDEKKAAELDGEYLKGVFTPEEKRAWEEKNYVYVADHFVGYLEFEGDGIFSYYPYKDWYYKEILAK
jgi:hypothetical protein